MADVTRLIGLSPGIDSCRPTLYEVIVSQFAPKVRKRSETEVFWEFCRKHLSHRDEAAWGYFGTERARVVARRRVAVMLPGHGVDQCIEHFRGLFQFWRMTSCDRLDEST